MTAFHLAYISIEWVHDQLLFANHDVGRRQPQLRLSIGALILCLTLAASGCGESPGDRVSKLRPQPHPLVDNFFLGKGGSGDPVPLGGTAGSFVLKGRCLELRTGEKRRTPVFMGQTKVQADGIVVRGRTIPYGSVVRLMNIRGGIRLAKMPNPACPTEGIVLRSIDE